MKIINKNVYLGELFLTELLDLSDLIIANT